MSVAETVRNHAFAGLKCYHVYAPESPTFEAPITSYLTEEHVRIAHEQNLSVTLHMVRARAAVLQAGGAERSNVFTRVLLALFGQVPWRAVPVMPLEIMHLPLWFPFHLSKVSYWSRTVIVPLLLITHGLGFRIPLQHRPAPAMQESRHPA